MARELFEYREEARRIVKFLLSDDWAGRNPWAHKGVVLPWWGGRFKEETECVAFTMTYFGPFAMLSGTWIDQK